MRKYWVFILMLFVAAACQKDEVQEEERAEESDLFLKGSVANTNIYELGGSAFKVQLIKGEIDVTGFDESYSHPEAQIFITEKGCLDFEFNGLQEGKYTLWVTKRGYKSFVKVIELNRRFLIPVLAMMEKGDGGLTDGMQILDENGKEISEMRIDRYTASVFFYLYNGKGTCELYNIQNLHKDNLERNVIIDGECVHLYSNWLKEIKPCSGLLNPNEIILIELVVDPLTYLLKKHSDCNIYINLKLRLNLSY